MANDMNPTDWGSKEGSHQFISIMTEKNAAPDKLLNVIHCNCSAGCKFSRCSCRRYGLPCTATRGPCQTENPNNTQEIDIEEEEEDDDEDTDNLTP